MGLKEAAPVETSRAVRAEVRSGSSLCENPNVEFARRNIVSIAFNRKRTLLPITVEWGQDRKRFCAVSARAGFHTALYEDFRVKCYCNSMSFVVRGSV